MINPLPSDDAAGYLCNKLALSLDRRGFCELDRFGGSFHRFRGGSVAGDGRQDGIEIAGSHKPLMAFHGDPSMPSYWRAHSRVRAERALDDARSHLEVEVVARQGAVRIRGSSSIHEIAEIQRVAQGVPGVVNLNLEEMVSLVRA